MKRSLGAELAIGTAETTSSAITRLEMKILASTSEGLSLKIINQKLSMSTCRGPGANQASSVM
jgi:hypothetical protein